MNLSNAAYDRLKFVVQILLPALGTFYFTLAGIFGLPYGEQLVGSLAAAAVFLGVFLRRSDTKYQQIEPTYDGRLVVETTLEGRRYNLEVDTPLDELDQQDALLLKIAPPE